MKFVYQYRTSDNVSHVGEIKASTRDEAFVLLKQRGIRPGHVERAPGFFNMLQGLGKRWLAIGLLIGAVAWLLFVRQQGTASESSNVEERSQIYGDPSILQRCVAQHWKNAFTDMGDVFLAQFAQPGVVVENFNARNLSFFAEALKRSGSDTVVIAPDDYPEVAKMKRIVIGMKLELEEYVKAGGTHAGYVERLIDRQNTESKIVAAANGEFSVLERKGRMTTDRANIRRVWNSKNDLLRSMGLPTKQIPEEWDE